MGGIVGGIHKETKMPKKTIYIRVEDLPLWEQCEDKALLVHNALRASIKPIARPIAPIAKTELIQTTIRSKHEIMQDIKALETQRDEELEYCQDRETKKQIEQSYQVDLSSLWEEYHATI